MRWHDSPPHPLTAMSDYTIYLTEAEAEWIAKHKEETGAGSRSRVIRDALEHYRQAVENNTAEASQ